MCVPMSPVAPKMRMFLLVIIEARVVTVVGLAFRRRFYEYEFTRLLSRSRRIGVLGVN